MVYRRALEAGAAQNINDCFVLLLTLYFEGLEEEAAGSGHTSCGELAAVCRGHQYNMSKKDAVCVSTWRNQHRRVDLLGLLFFWGKGLILAQAQDKDGSILNLQSSTSSIVCPTGGNSSQ